LIGGQKNQTIPDALAALGLEIGLTKEDFKGFDGVRDKTLEAAGVSVINPWNV